MPVTGSGAKDRKIAKILLALNQYGELIEQKFNNSRQYDFNASDVKWILEKITRLDKSRSYINTKSIEAIKNLCASAISLYYEPENRPYFFQQLRRIGRLLINLK